MRRPPCTTGRGDLGQGDPAAAGGLPSLPRCRAVLHTAARSIIRAGFFLADGRSRRTQGGAG